VSKKPHPVNGSNLFPFSAIPLLKERETMGCGIKTSPCYRQQFIFFKCYPSLKERETMDCG